LATVGRKPALAGPDRLRHGRFSGVPGRGRRALDPGREVTIMLGRVGLLAGAAALASAMTGPAGAETLMIACGVGPGQELCKEATDAWSAATGHEVRFLSTPNSATEQLALFQQFFAARSPDVDVFQVDVIWPGILGDHLVDLSAAVPAAELDQHFARIVENNTVGGKLVAMPWFTDVAMLYYRKDLLEAAGKVPPATWQELEAVASELQAARRAAGDASMWGFVYQGRAYEGLTCNALEWIDSWGGGTIVDADGKVTVNNPNAAEAITWAASTVGTIAPDGVLNYSEEEARGVFQSGNAVFMRNWPYAWALAQTPESPVSGKIGVVALPAGGADGKHTGTLGGWQLAVSAYSRHQEIATDLVRYLTSREEQKRRAIKGSYMPTIADLYDDPEVLAAVPFFAFLKGMLETAVARPSRVTGPKYNQVSAEFFNAVHEVLSKKTDAATSLASLEQRLDRLSRGGRW
jgi:trehalose/maltose transport system substrate-binding protein